MTRARIELPVEQQPQFTHLVFKGHPLDQFDTHEGAKAFVQQLHDEDGEEYSVVMVEKFMPSNTLPLLVVFVPEPRWSTWEEVEKERNPE